MKPAVLLSILGILFVMSSCTSESDMLNDMAGQDNTGTNTSSTLTFSIKNENETATKAGQKPATDDEAAIKNVIYFLLEGNDVIGMQEVTTGNTPCQFTTKQEKDLSVIAVANASPATANLLKGKSTRDGIKEVSVNKADLSNFIKFGDQRVNLSNASNEVTVTQVAARIDLAKLTVNVESSKEKSIVLKNVELKNRNTNGKLDMSAQTLIAESATVNKDQSFQSGITQENIAALYSFANNGNGNEANASSMILTFDVDGQEIVKEFKIKHNEEGYLIKAGHLYQLDVTVNVKNPEINLKVTVVKWTEHPVEVSFGK